MSRAVKIAISLPSELLDAVEENRKERGQSRSEFFREAASAAIAQPPHEDESKDEVAQYVQGYRRQPETQQETEAIHQVSLAALAREPWD